MLADAKVSLTRNHGKLLAIGYKLLGMSKYLESMQWVDLAWDVKTRRKKTMHFFGLEVSVNNNLWRHRYLTPSIPSKAFMVLEPVPTTKGNWGRFQQVTFNNAAFTQMKIDREKR